MVVSARTTSTEDCQLGPQNDPKVTETAAPPPAPIFLERSRHVESRERQKKTKRTITV
eukprot:COSAG01_NODE_49981_length_367_cov_1.328358_1_plen_57_part_10